MLERRPDRRVLVGGVLQLDDAQRQPVDEQHDVRPAFVLVLDDRELVHCEPVVGLRFVEVEYADLRAMNRTVSVDILHRHAVDHHAVKGAIAGFQRRAGRMRQAAECIVEGVGGEAGIESSDRGAQPLLQHDLAVIDACRVLRIGRDVGTVGDCPAAAFEPSEGGGFDGGFRQGRIAHAANSSRFTTRTSRSISRTPARHRK